ncbi:SMI1/KNR4 family protein [Streptosporangium oxazolinicum]
MITSRKVRLALAAAVLAAVVVAVARLWRRAEERRVALPIEGSGATLPIEASRNVFPAKGPIVSSVEEPDSGAGRAPRWPPAPILGTPTDEDLRRYAGPPSAFRTTVERMFERRPRTPGEPLDEGTRSRLVRWTAAGIAVCLLAFGTQLLESAVFSNGVETVEVTDFGSLYGTDEQCGPDTRLEPGLRFTDEQGVASAYVVGCVEQDSYLAEPAQPYEAPSPYETPAPYETPSPYETAATPVAVPDADCHPRARTPKVRALNPRVTRAVNRQWRRIERWLEANAPASRRTLGGPASARTIAVAEAQMGLRFPDDLRASLLRHDGASLVAGTWPFGFLGNQNQGVREIRDAWRQLCGIDAEVEGAAELDADVRAEWWDGRMIPFGADGSGNHLVIDSVVRDVGDTDHEGQMSFTPGGIRISSYYGLLRMTANVLETGGSIGYWKPVVTGGELRWDVVED